MRKIFIWSRLGALVVAGCLAAPLAHATVIDFTTSGLGTWTPASAYNSDTEVPTGANKLVTWYNGGTNPNVDPGVVFALSPGTGVPAPALPSPLTFGAKDESGPFDSFNPADYSYVLGKYGNTAYLFYIGNLAPGSYSLPATGANGRELSHEVLFAAGASTRVPDGGTTMALLGFGLLCLEALRRTSKFS